MRRALRERRALGGLLAVLACLAAPVTALAADSAAAANTSPAPSAPPELPAFSWLGEARGISRGWSASRDTPAMGWVLAPHEIRTAGGEFALLTWRRPTWTLRAGFAGFVEIESDKVTYTGDKGNLLWRGTYAGYAAFAFDALGKRICPRCALELTAQYRHESQHYTGSNVGDAGEDVSNEPYVGNDVIFDGALSEAIGDWYFAERLYLLWYVPHNSSYSEGAGLDLHVRYTRWQLVNPFLSLYGEERRGTELGGRDFPNAHRWRAMLGVALPSALGDILVYGFGDSGNRYGIRGLTDESTLGFGVRLSIGGHASP